jgi:phosphoenolpyruvate carboxykinase (ATP)
MLIPKNTWQDKEAYDVTARKLARQFSDHFDKSYGNKSIKASIVSQCPGK